MITSFMSKKIKKKILFFLLFLVSFTARKIYQFQDFNPTVIVEKNISNKIDSKIIGEFKAKHNNLGTISLKLDVTKSDPNNHIIFKIKNKNQNDWFYENTYPTDSSLQNNNIFFPFGFPIINNSKNETYRIEISSTDGKIESIISPKNKNPIFLNKYSFPKTFLLKNKNEIPKFIFSKTKSLLNHLNLINVFFIFVTSIILAKIFSSKPCKDLLKFVFHPLNQTKNIDQKDKLILSLPFFLGIIILITIIILLFKKHTEPNEWLIYEFSSVVSFIGSILFFKFFSKINYKFFRNFVVFSSLFFTLITLSLWFIFGIISFRYILIIFGLSLIPSFIYHRKDILSFLKTYIVNAFFISNIAYFFVLDIDTLNIFYFCGLLILIVALFVFFKNHKLYPPKLLKNKITTSIIIIIFTTSLVFFKRDIEYHHYSFYIGPAYEILHGKSILNNFPSQYGYLPIHIISFLLKPKGVTFESFHLFNLVSFIFYFFGFSLIYLKLIKNYYLIILFSIVTTITQIIFSIHSSYLGPSTGLLRFGPGLLVILSFLYLPKKIKIPVSTIISAIALFWSTETAIYVIPAWMFFVFYFHFQQSKHFIKNTLKSYLFFLVSTLVVLSIISIYEYQLTKEIPNFLNYIQFALAYQNGVATELIPLIGNYYIAITILLSGLLVSNYFLIKHHSNNLITTLSFVSIHNVAIFSYFISRSNQNNTLNIFPFLILETLIIYKIINSEFKINLYKYLSIPIFIFITFLAVKCIQNSFSHNSKIIRVKQKSPTAVQQYNSIKNIYGLNSKNVLIISKDWDTPIILDNKIETILPLNPSQMTVILKDKYLNPNFNKVNIGTTLVYTNDMPELLDFFKKHFILKPIAESEPIELFDLYTFENKTN